MLNSGDTIRAVRMLDRHIMAGLQRDQSVIDTPSSQASLGVTVPAICQDLLQHRPLKVVKSSVGEVLNKA